MIVFQKAIVVDLEKDMKCDPCMNSAQKYVNNIYVVRVCCSVNYHCIYYDNTLYNIKIIWCHFQIVFLWSLIECIGKALEKCQNTLISREFYRYPDVFPTCAARSGRAAIC